MNGRIFQDENLINTAVLSGKQIAMPMKIFAVTEGGDLNDVTSSSHCLSAESRVLKTSPTCSSLYVDGHAFFTSLLISFGLKKCEVNVGPYSMKRWRDRSFAITGDFSVESSMRRFQAF